LQKKSSIPAALLQFLFQRVEILCLKKLTQGDIQSVADLFNGRYGGAVVGACENIMHGRLGHSAEHGQVVQRYIPFPAEFPDTLLDRFR
jgi:hypothetical protein